MKIRALMAVAIVEASTGNIISIPHGGIAEISDELAESLIHDGIAEEYTLISPTGTVSITENGTVDVMEYASANVNVGMNISQFCKDGYLTTLTPSMLKGVTTIEESFFNNSKELVSVELPSSVTTIEKKSFYMCSKLRSVDLYETGVTNLGDESEGEQFSLCTSLTNVRLPKGLQVIGENVFNQCTSLNHIILPDTLLFIADPFYGCTSLTSITIPAKVHTIQDGAFNNCTSLASITVLAIEPPDLYEEFKNVSPSLTIYVPTGSVEAYKTADVWSNMASKIQAIQSN